MGGSSTKGGGKRGECGLSWCIRGRACGCGGFGCIAETAENRTKTARKVGQTAPSDGLNETTEGGICGACGYLYAMGDKAVYPSPAAGSCACSWPGGQVTDGRAASGGRPPGVSLKWCSGGAASGGRAPSNLGGSCAGRPLRAGPGAGPLVPARRPGLKRYAARSRQTGADC